MRAYPSKYSPPKCFALTFSLYFFCIYVWLLSTYNVRTERRTEDRGSSRHGDGGRLKKKRKVKVDDVTLATRARYGAVSDAETRPRVSWFVRKIDLSVKTGSQPTLNALLRWRRAWTCRLVPTSPRSFIVVPLTLASLGLAYKLRSGSCRRQNVAESVAIPFESPPPLYRSFLNIPGPCRLSQSTCTCTCY